MDTDPFNNVPFWLSQPEQSLLPWINSLSAANLRRFTSKMKSETVPKPPMNVKDDYVEYIVRHFHEFGRQFCQLVALYLPEGLNVHSYLFEQMTHAYGHELCNVLRRSALPVVIHEFALRDLPSPHHFPGSFQEQLSKLCALSSEQLSSVLTAIPRSIRPVALRPSKKSKAQAILFHVLHFCDLLSRVPMSDLQHTFLALFPSSTDCPTTESELVLPLLMAVYTKPVICALQAYETRAEARSLYHNELQKSKRSSAQKMRAKVSLDSLEEHRLSWPQLIPDDVKLSCMRDMYEGMKWSKPKVCAVCARARMGVEIYSVTSASDDTHCSFWSHFDLLTVNKEVFSLIPAFEYTYGCPQIDGHFLERAGFTVFYDHDSSATASLQVCGDCYSAVCRNVMPQFALANFLFRGSLPERFKDVTWIEERLCALHVSTAMVTRLFNHADNPRVLTGNTCSHDANIVSTVHALPRTPDNINGLLSVVFLGPGKFDKEKLRKSRLLHVRKRVVLDLLTTLQATNILYHNTIIDHDVLAMYPDDDIMPGIEDSVIHDPNAKIATMRSEETAGFDLHTSEEFMLDPDASGTLLEASGVSDPESVRSTGRSFTASALRSLLAETDTNIPDMVLHRGSAALSEYNNPNLFPGMFPLLFLYGFGGFEDPRRVTSIEFRNQAEAFLDLHDHCFGIHYSFIFVTVNIYQRRQAHLRTHFTVTKSNFATVARDINSISSTSLKKAATLLESEGNLKSADSDTKKALRLLSRVNTVSSTIPGSEASKLRARTEIRSYFTFFGMPHLFLTLNPNAVHSPVFHVMYGDETVDLSQRFPSLVLGSERARRVAADPIAATNFFEFSLNTLFKCLFGWDFEKRCSTTQGGILGKLIAFYGQRELSGRCNFHGHFVLWLANSVNPSEIHRRLRESDEYTNRFFAFFDDLIKHHVPDIDVDVPSSYEPRSECPPPPPKSLEDPDWISLFQSEVKKGAEHFQRHTHRKVCFKYDHATCRFQFPHEIVPVSYFDAETNSIFFRCLDATMNYFNEIMLVYCRHNIDLKCILSGMSAKAAMFYITDYLTKMDANTSQILSLLSQVVAMIEKADMDSNSEIQTPVGQSRAKLVLQKCLSQFARQRQIHAQQAVLYLRGRGDGIKSHENTPMMSVLLFSHVRKQYANLSTDFLDAENETETEDPHITISVDRQGLVRETTQVDDYLHRSLELSNVNFFDFCRCYSREKKVRTPKTSRLGTQRRFELLPPHALADACNLVEHTNESLGISKKLVPQLIGMSIPRPNNSQYPLFTLAHFKPFSASEPLIPSGSSVLEVFSGYEFSERAKQLIQNWDAIHESEDERDTDRLRKRASEANKTKNTKPSFYVEPDSEDEEIIHDFRGSVSSQISESVTLSELRKAHWIPRLSHNSTSDAKHESTPNTMELEFPDFSKQLIKHWNDEVKIAEANCIAARRARTQPESQINIVADVRQTEIHPLVAIAKSLQTAGAAQETELPRLNTLVAETDIVNKVAQEANLNDQQLKVYKIITDHFLQSRKAAAKNETVPPLRMMLTGPGGTGKTHVVNAVKKIMVHFGMGHAIRFLAPTGGAAAGIKGVTVHKGLKVSVKKKDKGKGSRQAGQSSNDYSVILTVKQREELRAEWKDVEYLFFDELSMLSASLFAEADASLRMAKEEQLLNEIFANVSLIGAGDLYQYPPVGGAPLYRPIDVNNKDTGTETLARLGRLSYKSIDTVVSFTEQKRMEKDPEFAAAVARLRIRDCTEEDLELFNSRVLYSTAKPNGIVLDDDMEPSPVAIVQTNALRMELNFEKSCSLARRRQKELVMVAADDRTNGPPLDGKVRNELIRMDFPSHQSSLPGRIPMFVGMPVILRNRNISTELGITNGSQGFLRHIYSHVDEYGITICDLALVEFPDSDVSLKGLPPKIFPITPITWRATTIISGQKIRFSRHQLPIQPAFAVTGQSAQGKTLPKVLADLTVGGFGAYVAASRPRCREDLFLTQPLTTLEQLNRKIPDALRMETKRLNALEHNTNVRYGFIQEPLVPVPDAETDINSSLSTAKMNLSVDFDTSKPSLKRQLKAESNGFEIQAGPRKRHRRKPKIADDRDDGESQGSDDK